MKLGRKEFLGDAGEAMPPVGVGRGEPLGDCATNGEVGSAIWVGRLCPDAVRDMVDDKSRPAWVAAT